MSRIGKKPVMIPDGVEVTIKNKDIIVKGPKGELSLRLHPRTSVKQETLEAGEALMVTVKDNILDSAIWGTMRALISNLVTGVTEGFTKQLELNGVGFKMKLQGSTLILNLGFSHEIKYEIPSAVEANIEGNVLTLTGADSQILGQTASEIRAFKKPEPYKGKGFRYVDEIIQRKAGKAAKTE